jgi:hypothetical protein
MIVSLNTKKNKNLFFYSNLVKDLIYVTQRYEHRHDKLEVREHDVKTNMVYENYLPGRYDHLKGKTSEISLRTMQLVYVLIIYLLI